MKCVITRFAAVITFKGCHHDWLLFLERFIYCILHVKSVYDMIDLGHVVEIFQQDGMKASSKTPVCAVH